MRVIRGTHNLHTLLMMYKQVCNAPEVEIRGRKVRNLSNMAVLLEAGKPILTDFAARNFNLTYAKKEWLWYLGADPKDDSICEYATMWKKLQQEDGTFYSNYGQYIFGDQHLGRDTQFAYVIRMLKDDPHTRRASMVLLQPYHLYKDNTDTVCTYGINFTIEEGYLNMTVMMRSNDVIFGFTNDAFCFSQLYDFVFAIVKHKYPDLQTGVYTHFTNSMHVYEPHYEMIRAIVSQDAGGYKWHNPPKPKAEEVVQIVESYGKEGSGEYYTWLTT